MECLRTTSPALQQLSLHECSLRRLNEIGRITHCVHRLSSMLVTFCCLKPVDCLGSVPKMPRRIKQELPPGRGCNNFLYKVYWRARIHRAGGLNVRPLREPHGHFYVLSPQLTSLPSSVVACPLPTFREGPQHAPASPYRARSYGFSRGASSQMWCQRRISGHVVEVG
jgi:hypothetical protein